jgi:hypothetical protein
MILFGAFLAQMVLYSTPGYDRMHLDVWNILM